MTASDDGKVRLFNYPCVVEEAPSRQEGRGKEGGGVHGDERREEAPSRQEGRRREGEVQRCRGWS